MLSQREIGGSYLASPHKARDLLNSTGRELPIDIEMAVAEFNGIYLELGRQIAKDLRAVGFNPTLRAWNPSHYTKALIEEPEEYQPGLGALPPPLRPMDSCRGTCPAAGQPTLWGTMTTNWTPCSNSKPPNLTRPSDMN